jgi:CysZ protein
MVKKWIQASINNRKQFMVITPRSGFGYFFYGLQIALSPGIRRYVLLPLLLNTLLIGGSLFYLFSNLNNVVTEIMGQVPTFLSWLNYVIWPLLVITILGTFGYFFSTLTNILASPLNGLLAEKVEAYLDGETISQTGMWSFVKDIPRVLSREWRKQVYILPKALGIFLLLLIPGLGQTVGPVVWFIFTAWMLGVQYCDYPFDNHKIEFSLMRKQLKTRQTKVYGFGMLTSLFTTLPIINLFIMPIAVCGATAMWVCEFKQDNKI